MVEVGASGPEFLSHSKFFRDDGWRTICIEPNPNFVELHKKNNNEIYEYACSNENKNDVDFIVVDLSESSSLSFESFSSLKIKNNILYGYKNFLTESKLKKIKVNVRTLDFILEEAKVFKLDCVIIDVEGWEIEVMKGFTTSKYKPKVIVLECMTNFKMYHQYMESINYQFDKLDDTNGPNYIYFNSKY